PGQEGRRRLGFRHARILPGPRTTVACRSALRAAGNLVLVLVGHVDCRLFRSRAASVDAYVLGDEVRLSVWMGSLVLGDQAAGPRLLLVVGLRAFPGQV